MSFCSVCGIRYQTNDLVCSGCGSELMKEWRGENIIESVAGDVGGLNLGMTPEQREPGVGSNMESQLGKGLIKPHSVEFGIDGFHFKYDKPLRNFPKIENSKDKVVEFRVTCPEPGSEVSSEESIEVAKSVSTEVTKVTEAEKTVEVEISNYTDETIEQPLEKETGPAGEELSGEFPEVQLESVRNDAPEPELEITRDTEILWEDTKRWLGIPMAIQYRISNESLQIIETSKRKFSEIDLILISEVKLKQSWLDKLFGTGDLLISVKHLPETGLVLVGIRNSESVRRLITNLINAAE